MRDAAFDRASGLITITFSEAVDPATLTVGAAGDAIEIEDAEDPAAPLQSGQLTVAGRVAALQLDTAQLAWWRDRPVRLAVGPPAADAEGNVMANRFETVFFPGSSSGLAGGFLFGETYDDHDRPAARRGGRRALRRGPAAAGQRAPPPARRWWRCRAKAAAATPWPARWRPAATPCCSRKAATPGWCGG